jgi:peptide chain release factor 2
MHDLNTKAQELNKQLQEIKQSFDLEERKKILSKLESDSMDDRLWDNQDNARKVMQELSDVKAEIDEIESIDSEISTLVELANEEGLSADFKNDLARLDKKLDKFRLATFLSGKYDKKNAILGIHAGQGGTEAMDWTNMLYRMYTRLAERKGWNYEIIDITQGEEAGLKAVTLKIIAPYAYGFLKGEVGTHRLVRQSPFNADKLRQTSFALVEVMPELEESDMPDINIKDEDLEWQFYRAGGHGGQNVNKVSTAVRVKHIPTGLVVTAQTERVQEQNRKNALDLLKAKLFLMEQEKEEKEKQDIKGTYTPASWGTQIRSYVLHPYKMVKDLRTEVESSNPDAVLDGDLDEFLEAQVQQL